MSKREDLMSAFFDDIVQWEMQGSGIVGKLPVFYYDNTSMTAIFTAATKQVRRQLPDPGLHLVEMTPGRCLVAISCFEYRKTDIDPYNELSIAFLVSYGKKPLVGVSVLAQLVRRSFSAYVWQLPVTTERARAGGVDLYGYPKFLADISFERSADRLVCELREGGKRVLVLAGKLPAARAGKQLRFRTYSFKDGKPLVANIVTNPLEFAETMSPSAATLTLGDEHPIAAAMRGMGLGEKPVMYQVSPRNEVILFGPRNLIDD